jgi:hypothetical protein
LTLLRQSFNSDDSARRQFSPAYDNSINPGLVLDEPVLPSLHQAASKQNRVVRKADRAARESDLASTTMCAAKATLEQ